MASVIEKKLYPLIDEELKAGVARWGLNHSNHESFAVVREELDEVRKNAQTLEAWAARAWEATKKNADGATIRELYEEIYKTAVNTAVEAIQVAAMADKAIRSNVEIMAQEMRAEHEAAGAHTDPAIVKAIEACQAVAEWKQQGKTERARAEHEAAAGELLPAT